LIRWLHLSAGDRHGLVWAQRWARCRLTAMKRDRKYRPRELVLPSDEAKLLQALLDLEKAAGRLLQGENLG